ncbi:MAG: hypothetical protein ACRENP_17385 [Longimicrobiales bacterium]
MLSWNLHANVDDGRGMLVHRLERNVGYPAHTVSADPNRGSNAEARCTGQDGVEYNLFLEGAAQVGQKEDEQAQRERGEDEANAGQNATALV